MMTFTVVRLSPSDRVHLQQRLLFVVAVLHYSLRQATVLILVGHASPRARYAGRTAFTSNTDWHTSIYPNVLRNVFFCRLWRDQIEIEDEVAADISTVQDAVDFISKQ